MGLIRNIRKKIKGISTRTRLMLLACFILGIDVSLLGYFYMARFHLNWYIPFTVLILPFLSLAIEVQAWDKKNRLERFTHCRYSRFCSFFFRHEPEYRQVGNINIDAIKDVIESGDILLRRYTYYLDELVFSQHSFFTHVGIFICDEDKKNPRVLHATGKQGVHRTGLDEFCRCDNVAILRFSTDKGKELIERILEDKEVTEEEMEEIKNFIIYDDHTIGNEPELNDKELIIFNSLMDNITSKKITADSIRDTLRLQGYKSIISNRAMSLEGAKYDWQFNFRKFDSFSCIEYVWYSFKCLFPLHRIEIKDFEYFKCIVMPVIIPDVFIKNDFFEYIHSSLPNVTSKNELKEKAKPNVLRLWRFPLNILFWYAVILGGSYFVPKFLFLYFLPVFIIIKLLDVIISNHSFPEPGYPRSTI